MPKSRDRVTPDNPRNAPRNGARLASERRTNGIGAQSNPWTAEPPSQKRGFIWRHPFPVAGPARELFGCLLVGRRAIRPPVRLGGDHADLTGRVGTTFGTGADAG